MTARQAAASLTIVSHIVDAYTFKPMEADMVLKRYIAKSDIPVASDEQSKGLIM